MNTVRKYLFVSAALILMVTGCSQPKGSNHGTNSEPVIEEKIEQPVVQEEIQESIIHESDIQGSDIHEQANEPGVEAENQNPVEAEKNIETVVEKEVKNPVVKEQATAPVIEEKAKEPEIVADKSAELISKKKSVLLYFYSDSVKGSRDDLPKIKEIAAANNADVVEIDALEDDTHRYSYSVEYVPTVYAIRPDSGMVARWMVDLPQKEIEAAISDKTKPVPAQEAIGKAISSKKPQLLFFMAQWCGYCRKLAPEVEKFTRDFSDKVEVVTIDIDKIPYRMKESYVIDGVPVIFITDENGLLVKRTGFPEGYNNYINYFKAQGMDMKKKS